VAAIGGGFKKFKMATVAMVTKVQKFLIQTVQRILLKLDTKIDHHSKLCSLLLKFSKWPPFQNGHQYKNFKNR
jgi:hypothetical protein